MAGTNTFLTEASVTSDNDNVASSMSKEVKISLAAILLAF